MWIICSSNGFKNENDQNDCHLITQWMENCIILSTTNKNIKN